MGTHTHTHTGKKTGSERDMEQQMQQMLALVLVHATHTTSHDTTVSLIPERGGGPKPESDSHFSLSSLVFWLVTWLRLSSPGGAQRAKGTSRKVQRRASRCSNWARYRVKIRSGLVQLVQTYSLGTRVRNA